MRYFSAMVERVAGLRRRRLAARAARYAGHEPPPASPPLRRLILALCAGAAGVVLLIAGLAVDAWLHARDTTLAEREGVLAFGNPGHLLLGAGLALAAAGVALALHTAWAMSGARGLLGRPTVRNTALCAASLAAAGAMAFVLAVAPEGHAQGAADAAQAHVHEPPAAAAEQPELVSAAPVATAGDVAGEDTAAAIHEHVAAPAMVAPMGEVAALAQSAQHQHVPADAAPDGEGMHAETSMRMSEMSAPVHAHRPKPMAEELTCLASLTAEIKAATVRFEDYDVAVAEGFRSNPAKPEATHYSNRTYMLDGVTMDYANPEALVYVTRDDGSKLLAGALFKAAKGNGPRPCGNATWWHTHGSCLDPATGERVEESPDKTCPAGYEHREGRIEMMHIWFVSRGQRG